MLGVNIYLGLRVVSAGEAAPPARLFQRGASETGRSAVSRILNLLLAERLIRWASAAAVRDYRRTDFRR